MLVKKAYYFEFFVLFLFIAWSKGLFAYDQQITSTLSIEGYSIGTASGDSIKRRSIIENLHLAAWNLLPGSKDPYYHGPWLSVELDMRINADYGVSHASTVPVFLDSYVPGLTPMKVELLFAYVDAYGLLDGIVDLRIGRQIRYDIVGIFAHDGFESRIRLPAGLSFESFLGYEVKGGKILGFENFELDGVDNVGRGDLDNAYFTSLEDPISRLSVGAALRFMPIGIIDTQVAIRAIGIDDDISAYSIGSMMAFYFERFQAGARAVVNPVFDDPFSKNSIISGTAVSDAELWTGVKLLRSTWFHLEYLLYRPVFMAESIFNVFGLLPRRDLGLRTETNLGNLSLASWGFLRFADELKGPFGGENTSLSGFGYGAGFNIRKGSIRLGTRMNLQKDSGFYRMGVESFGSRFFFNERLNMGVRVSMWHFDDIVVVHRSNSIMGYVFHARYKLSDMATLEWEFENHFGKNEASAFAVMAALHLDIWK